MNYSDGTITNSYATGAVTGINYVGGLVGDNSGTITKCFWSTDNRPHGLIGIGSGDGFATGETTANMQTLFFHKSTLEWSISGLASGHYPILGWQVVGKGTTWDGTSIWYLGPLPVENGGGNSGDFYFSGFTFTLPPLPVTARVLTAIPGKGANPIITPAFVTGGSPADLGRAFAAYNQAKQSYEANKGTMGAAEKALAEVELATAFAAIIALDLSLAAENGEAVNLADLITAYNTARAAFNSNRGLLSAEQVAEAEALLNAIASVISRFSS
jgi:hypothetical protein